MRDFLRQRLHEQCITSALLLHCMLVIGPARPARQFAHRVGCAREQPQSIRRQRLRWLAVVLWGWRAHEAIPMRWLKHRFAGVRRDPIPCVGCMCVRLRQPLQRAPRALSLPPVKVLTGTTRALRTVCWATKPVEPEHRGGLDIPAGEGQLTLSVALSATKPTFDPVRCSVPTVSNCPCQRLRRGRGVIPVTETDNSCKALLSLADGPQHGKRAAPSGGGRRQLHAAWIALSQRLPSAASPLAGRIAAPLAQRYKRTTIRRSVCRSCSRTLSAL